MPRSIQRPEADEHGREIHPAFGQINASRISSTPGAVLFDSDVMHQHSIRVTISTADRERNLNNDWIFSRKDLIEVEMSEAQWASFVSSMNTSGVPCTIRRTESDWDIPGLPFEPRLQESRREVHAAAEDAFGRITEAMVAYEQQKNAANLRNLRAAIQNATRNVDFVTKQLDEHVENVVQKARADVEAMVVQHARQLGIDPVQVDVLALPSGDSESRALTAEELRTQFMEAVQAYVSFWARTDHGETLEMRLFGVAHSILCLIDGSTDLPAFDLVARPHPDDKPAALRYDEDWVEDGTVINGDVILHTLLRQPEGAAGDPEAPGGDIRLIRAIRQLAEEFESGEYSAVDVGERILAILDSEATLTGEVREGPEGS